MARRSIWSLLLLTLLTAFATFCVGAALGATTTIVYPPDGTWYAANPATLLGTATNATVDALTRASAADFQGGSFNNTTLGASGGITLDKQAVTYRFSEDFGAYDGMRLFDAGSAWASAGSEWRINSGASTVLSGAPSAVYYSATCNSEAWWRVFPPGPMLQATVSFRYGISPYSNLVVGVNLNGSGPDDAQLLNVAGMGNMNRTFSGDISQWVVGRPYFFLHFRIPYPACSYTVEAAFDDLVVDVTVPIDASPPRVDDNDDFSRGMRASLFQPGGPGVAFAWAVGSAVPPSAWNLYTISYFEGSIYYRAATFTNIISASVSFNYDCISGTWVELYVAPAVGAAEVRVLQSVPGAASTFSVDLSAYAGSSGFVLRLWAKNTIAGNSCRVDDFNVSVGSDASAPGFVRGIYVTPPIDLGRSVRLAESDFSAQLPAASTASVELRLSGDGVVWGVWMGLPGPNVTGFPMGRYAQIRVFLWGSDIEGYPTLTSVTLRFFAITAVQVSLDNGSTWQAARAVPSGPDGDFDWDATVNLTGGGLQTLLARTLDTVGPGASVSVHLGLDDLPPTVPGVSDGPALVNVPSITWNWTAASDIGLGVVGYFVRLGSTPGGDEVIADQAAGMAFTFTFGTAQDGVSYYLSVSAQDGAGLRSLWSAPTAPTRVDLSPPPAPSPNGPTGWVAGRNATWTWTAPADASGVASYFVRLSRDADGVDTRLFVTTATGSFTLTDASENTPYYLSVRAVDLAGNVGPYSIAGAALYFDDSPPLAPGTPAVPPSPTNSAPLHWSWGPSFDSGSGMSGYEVAFGSASGGTDLVDWTYVAGEACALAAPSSGIRYFLSVRAVDEAGWRSAAVAASEPAWVDLESPAKVALLAVPSLTSQRAADITWLLAADPGGSGVASYEVEVSGAAPPKVTPLPASARSFTVNGQDGANMSIRVRALDAVGNVGPWSEAATVLFDWQGPGAPPNLVAAVDGNNVTFSWGASTDAGAGVSHYLVTVGTKEGGSDLALDVRVTATTYTLVGVAGVRYYAIVRAVDLAGNEGANTTSVVSVPPAASAPAPGLGAYLFVSIAAAALVLRKRRSPG